jgi:hypothetical protein
MHSLVAWEQSGHSLPSDISWPEGKSDKDITTGNRREGGRRDVLHLDGTDLEPDSALSFTSKWQILITLTFLPTLLSPFIEYGLPG